jgi:hypothetical protein
MVLGRLARYRTFYTVLCNTALTLCASDDTVRPVLAYDIPVLLVSVSLSTLYAINAELT